MSKAAQLAARLEPIGVAEGMQLIEGASNDALHFDVLGDAMCIMHSDGSVNIIENWGQGRVMVETISAANILAVLKHYRPFKEVFKNGVQ